jgi:predicted neuraminidase
MKFFVTGIAFMGALTFLAHGQENQSMCSFGMRMRKIKPVPEQVYEPVIVQKLPANESTILRMPNGTLKIFFINRPGSSDKMMSVSSADNGFSWGEPKEEFALPGTAYHANTVLIDDSGNVHCVFHIFGTGENGYRGRQLNLWYCHTIGQGKEWSQPQEIFSGYVGSLRGFIELKNKRLLLAFAKAMPGRAGKPTDTAAIDHGWNEIISLYSDNKGKSWHQSINSVKVAVESKKKTRYGAIEPSLLQLKNGTIWMLIRTNNGYLYQSFSKDGGRTWDTATRTKLVSSDSPAGLLRLSDNRILVFWCSDQRHDDPDSYANGGREALHAAISADEGKTWKGFREVLTSLCSVGKHTGDYGTAYPSATETKTGKVELVSGQGEAGAIIMFEPAWLENGNAYDDFSDGLTQWTFFGMESREGSVEGVWNFPMTTKGKLVLELNLKRVDDRISLAVTDHFSVSADTLASFDAPIYFLLPRNSRTGFLKLEIHWNSHRKEASLYCNGELKEVARFRRAVHFGLNYLRVGIMGYGHRIGEHTLQSVKLISL